MLATADIMPHMGQSEPIIMTVALVDCKFNFLDTMGDLTALGQS